MNEHSLNTQKERPEIYRNRLWKCTSILWLLTVVAAFEDGGLLKVQFPGIGALYGFRILLPVTAMFFAVWAIRYRIRLWREASALERWAYIFAAVMLVYGAISLVWAIEFEESFRRLFNLAFDMLFFCLLLQAFHDDRLRRKTLMICAICFVGILVLGVYEVFNGGLVNDAYEENFSFYWLFADYRPPIVFSQNTNDYSSSMLFLFSVLTVYGILWRCDSWEKILLTVCISIMVFFLNRAAGARLCFTAFCVFMLGVLLSIVFRKPNRKRALLAMAFVLVIFAGIYIGEGLHRDGEDSNRLFYNRYGQESLTDQFYEIAPETGKRVLRQHNSAGVRARLILHCINCMEESHFLGVGLGNTESLAEQRAVAIKYDGRPYRSIHCFVARVLSDYGIFAAIPMVAIGFLLLKSAYFAFRRGVRKRDRNVLSEAILFLFMLLTYPFLSTAPSDAQDLIPMWIFLAFAVWKADDLLMYEGEEENNDA